MTDLRALLASGDPAALIPALALATLASLLLAAASTILSLRIRAAIRGGRRPDSPAAQDASALLALQSAAIEKIEAKVAELADAVHRLESDGQGHIQHLGIVRYQAFPDVGGDLSFSLALLDGRQTGAVITGLWSRSECRIYAKPVVDGKCEYPLSDEELLALERALGHRPHAPVTNAHVRIGRRLKS